jgi:hypothetical protein
MPTKPFDPNQLYYVIIGCGFSGITNHAILQATGQRLGSLTVLHIGAPDPWVGYHPMPMGQWPSLLTLPGYQSQPANVTAAACLGSDEFATINQSEWNRLLANRPFAHLNARVTAVQAIGTPPTEYQIVLGDSGGTIVRAACVDVCAGPGPARGVPSGIVGDPALITEYEGGSPLYTPWPRLLSGERYLSASAGAEPSNKSLCVIGGGPTSAWCVEHAQSRNNEVLWLSNDSLNAAFVSSRRNDSLVAGVVRRKLVNGEHAVQGLLKPRSLTTIFAEGFEAHSIDTLPNQTVRVHFQPIPGKTSRYVDRSGSRSYPPYRDFDQVIYSIGQVTDVLDPKSWAYMLRPVLAGAISRKNHLIRDRSHRAVGLQSEDQLVRVLGAAALSHPDLQPQWTTPGTRSNLFLRSLTEQARVRVGITLAAVTIAEANRYWTTGPNENLNTAGLGDLKTLMATWDSALDGPQTWFETRGTRIPPFAHSEFGSLLTRKFQY